MINIVQTIASTRSDHGGTSRSVPALCSALAAQGEAVRLVTAAPATDKKAAVPILPSDGVRTHVVPEHGWLGRTFRAPIAFYRALRDEVQRERPDVLHDHGAWLPSNGAAALVARSAGIPLVVTPRGMLTDWALQFNRWKKKAAWWAYQKHVLQQAALFHVTSQEEVEALRELGFGQPAVIIPNGVNLPTSGHSSPSLGGSRCALFLSRLHPKKGVPMLIDAWAEVRPDGWELVLVGPSENGQRTQLERQVRRYELDEKVTFVGSVSDEAK